ncbi:MAG: zinc metallopeptidase [Oscillospiraceae bacterium]|nr:zinc metallopeptidase [Oscillospiraceae bacterium]
MYVDWTYIIFILPPLLFSMWASARVRSSYNKYSSQLSRRGLTAAQAVQYVLRSRGLHNVSIQRVSGQLTDHFDPRENVIRLSEGVFDSTSSAAIGVACHEAGHAIQYAEGYGPLKVRNAIIPVTNLGAQLSGPLIMAGFIMAGFSQKLIVLAYLGVLCFALSTVFQLITLPVEFDASRRAMAAIDSQNLLTEDEQKGVKSVLSAAALTYVAALAVSLMQLLRFVVLLNRRRD